MSLERRRERVIDTYTEPSLCIVDQDSMRYLATKSKYIQDQNKDEYIF